MIKWRIELLGCEKKYLRACLLDILLIRACIKKFEDYEEYIKLSENIGNESSKNSCNKIAIEIMNGASKLNWDGYKFYD